MNQGDSIVIEKVANGWLVKPLHTQNAPVLLSDVQVFQRLAYDDHGNQFSEGCVFGFLCKHFGTSA